MMKDEIVLILNFVLQWFRGKLKILMYRFGITNEQADLFESKFVIL